MLYSSSVTEISVNPSEVSEGTEAFSALKTYTLSSSVSHAVRKSSGNKKNKMMLFFFFIRIIDFKGRHGTRSSLLLAKADFRFIAFGVDRCLYAGYMIIFLRWINSSDFVSNSDAPSGLWMESDKGCNGC